MRLRRRSLSAFLLSLSISVAVPLPADADAAPLRMAANKDRRFFSAREGVGIEAPPGWSLSLHTGYPNVLAALVHPGGSRISLAVDRTKAADARRLVDESRPGLVAQGFNIDRVQAGPHGGVQLEARAVRNKRTIRQLYLVRPLDGAGGFRQAVIVTLTTPDDQAAAAAGPFEWVLGRLTLETPLRPDRSPDGGT